MITIDITIETENWGDCQSLRNLCERATAAWCQRLGFETCDSELSMVFTDDDHIRQINAQWRRKDQATNVLSFPAFDIKIGETPGPMLGDIVLARATIEREAVADRKSFDDHLTHLIIHGLLHLVGYDHEEASEAETMEQIEREILQSLAIHDPYDVSIKAGND